jgi:hypothetical protein
MPTPPLSFVPIPTAEYRQHRKAAKLLDQPGRPSNADAPLPYAFGARVLMWKQDPSVSELGTRKAYLPGVVLDGPRDARICPGVPVGLPGATWVTPNAFGDFIAKAGTREFDAVHTFAVVRQVLTMYQRALATAGRPSPLPWAWNSADNVAPIQLFPHGLPNTVNAFYSRSQNCLKFGDFLPGGSKARVYTCRSLDIVAHETGHAILDGLKPGWLMADQPPQTGGLHEAFGDLTAIFLALSQLDQCEAVIAQTKANLHDKTFLADIAEQFGLALGRPNGLRNADTDFTLDEAGDQVHALSQVFTSAIYDILADLFDAGRSPNLKDDAAVLHQTGETLRGLVLTALLAAPDQAATYADVARAMLANVDQAWQASIRLRFGQRGVDMAASPAPMPPALAPGAEPVQDRRACCGTMNLPEYYDLERVLEGEKAALARWFAP